MRNYDVQVVTVKCGRMLCQDRLATKRHTTLKVIVADSVNSENHATERMLIIHEATSTRRIVGTSNLSWPNGNCQKEN